MCWNRQRVNEVSFASSRSSASCLGIDSILVSEGRISGNSRTKGIFVTCEVQGVPLKYKLETGADVTCLGKRHATKLNLPIHQTSLRLKGAGNTSLEVIGFVKMRVVYQKSVPMGISYIVRGQKEPSMSRDLDLSLGLVSGNV